MDGDAFAELRDFLASLHRTLFPVPFTQMPYAGLTTCIQQLTGHLNATLDHYHTLPNPSMKMRVKPTLIFVQDLLAQMARLLRFEPRHLTPHNQILADFEHMLVNRDALINDECTRRAEFELQLIQDQKLREMLEAAFLSYLE